MHIELQPHVGINLVTGKEQTHQQYMVCAGHPAKLELYGFLSWKEGSKIVFIRNVDPILEKKIVAEVKRLLEVEADAVHIEDLDQDQINPTPEDEYNEFDESDLT